MSQVLRIYQEVIDDVIAGVREHFLEDHIDEHVLQELKQTWEAKLHASKAIQNHQNDEKGIKKVELANGVASGSFNKLQGKQVVGQVPPNNHVHTQPMAHVIDATKMVPIQITLPAQPSQIGSDVQPGQRVLTIQVPASALQGNQLHKVLTGPVISATMGLPQQIANNLLQQHVNAALGGASQTVAISQVVNKTVIQGDGALNSSDDEMDCPPFSIKVISNKSFKSKRKKPIVIQFDGSNNTSDEEDDVSDDNDASDDIDDDKDDDEQEMEDTGPEEEPLNSEDDVTDEDPSDLFDTENVVVCQYDKINRARNKWRFHLKDGIMNLNGEDLLFQKANGDAEW